MLMTGPRIHYAGWYAIRPACCKRRLCRTSRTNEIYVGLLKGYVKQCIESTWHVSPNCITKCHMIIDICTKIMLQNQCHHNSFILWPLADINGKFKSVLCLFTQNVNFRLKHIVEGSHSTMKMCCKLQPVRFFFLALSTRHILVMKSL